jgi:hypothetical protein
MDAKLGMKRLRNRTIPRNAWRSARLVEGSMDGMADRRRTKPIVARLNCKVFSQILSTFNLSLDFLPTRLHVGGYLFLGDVSF